MNAPRKPTAKNNRKGSETEARENAVKVKSIKNDPKAFTNKVAYGKVGENFPKINKLTRYLKMEPNAPPIAI